MSGEYQTMMYVARKSIELKEMYPYEGLDITCCEESCFSNYYEPRKTQWTYLVSRIKIDWIKWEDRFDNK